MAMRLLEERDEPAVVALLREVYGDTYSYRDLYEPGGAAALIRSGRAFLWGDFDEAGHLLGHSGFLCKDPRGAIWSRASSIVARRGRRRTASTTRARA